MHSPNHQSLSQQWQKTSQTHPDFQKIRRYMQEDSESIRQKYQREGYEQRDEHGTVPYEEQGRMMHDELAIEGKTIDEHAKWNDEFSSDDEADDGLTPRSALSLARLETLQYPSRAEKSALLQQFRAAFERTCAEITKIDGMATQQLRGIAPEIAYKSHKRAKEISQIMEDSELSEEQRDALRELMHDEEEYEKSMKALFEGRNINM